MKKTFTTIMVLLLVGVNLFASDNWTIQNKAYKVDTLKHLLIGPGTTLTALSLSGGSTQQIYYTETDLTNPYVKVKASNGSNKVGGRTTLSNQSATYSTDSTIYFAGVNADFFNIRKTDEPMGKLMIDGEFYTKGMGGSGYTAVGFTDNNEPFLGSEPVANFIIEGNSAEVNTTRGNNNSLVIYTNRFGTSTGTDNNGSEVVVAPADGSKILRICGDMPLTVVENPTANKGNHAITEGQFVLSGTGTMATFINGLKAGQTITMKTSFTFDGEDMSALTQCVGGCPLILKDGVVLDTEKALDHLLTVNPRTAVGYNADKTKLILLVVDGRSKTSAGVVSKQLADIMLNLGCTDAMNLDGGGSTELYSSDFGIINSPSDKTEREVTDAIFLVTNAPVDNEVGKIRYMGTKQTVAQYSSYSPSFYGYNKYGVLLTTDFTGAKLTCDEELGEPTEDGTAIFCKGVGDYVITATVGSDIIQVPVTVVESNPTVNDASIFDDSFKGAKVNVTTKVGTTVYPVDNHAFTWSSDDPSIATVDENGVIKGVANGQTVVRASMDGKETEINVTVEIPTQHTMLLDEELDPSTWVAKQAGSTDLQLTNEDGVLSFVFTGSSSSIYSASFEKEIRIWSMPDSIRAVINPGEATLKSVIFTLRTANNKTVTGSYRTTLENNVDNVVELPMSTWTGLTSASYPVTLTSVKFNTAKFTPDQTYNIRLSGLETIYNAIPEDPTGIKNRLASNPLQNNLFTANRNGEITFSSPLQQGTEMRIYDISGHLLHKSVLTEDKTSLTLPYQLQQKGFYIIHVKNGTTTQSAKLYIR